MVRLQTLLHQAPERHGRAPETLKVMPGLGDPLPVGAISATDAVFTPRVDDMLDRAARDRLTIRACAREVARSRSHGLFRRDYAGTTLREHLGDAVPRRR